MAKVGVSRPSTIIEGKAVNINRDDIDSRKVDFSDIASGRRLPPVHPGEILRDEFVTPLGISVYELAAALILKGTRTTL
jgi:hypothetical protein